jgi:D-alanyl-D-alanine endopeptidase (penicillin-binding protein 7)
MIQVVRGIFTAVTSILISVAALSVSPVEAAVKKESAKASKIAKPAAKKAAKKKAAPPRLAHNIQPAALHRTAVAEVAGPASLGMLAGLHQAEDPLSLKSAVAFVEDLDTKQVLFAKNPDAVLPIASITKLMTAMVVLDAKQALDEVIAVTDDDVDTEKFSRSRLRVGVELSRADMIHLALMASENRAANALGRNYPGGLSAFVAAMNAKAQALGMKDSRFVEPTGLSRLNVSSGPDLAKMVSAAYKVDLIRQYSTDTDYTVEIGRKKARFNNTNALLKSHDWDISVSKTGFISEAGRCLVMHTKIEGRHVAIVLLDSFGKYSRLGDANRLKKWIESAGIATLGKRSA